MHLAYSKTCHEVRFQSHVKWTMILLFLETNASKDACIHEIM